MAKKEKEIKEEKIEPVEAQPVQTNEEPTEPIPVVQTYEYNDEVLKTIEDNRATFLKKYRFESIWKWVVSAIGIGLLVFAFLGVPNIVTAEEYQALRMSLMVGIGLFSLVLMLTFTFVSKYFLNKKAKKYFGDFYNNVTKYVMSDKAFKEVDCDAQRKLDRIQFDENLLFKGVDMVGSRALTNLKYNETPLLVCDCAAQVRVDRRPKPVFVGKYVVSTCNYDNDEPIFVYVKGDEKRSLPPTNMDDFKLAFDDDKISVYSNNDKWNKYFTSKLKNKVLQLKTGNSLVDISISFKSKRLCVCLGYDDDLMVLPLEKPFNPKPTEEYKAEFHKLVKIIEELNK